MLSFSGVSVSADRRTLADISVVICTSMSASTLRQIDVSETELLMQHCEHTREPERPAALLERLGSGNGEFHFRS